MKKFTCAIFLSALTSYLANAQQWSGNNNTTDVISRTGSVGIGTSSPVGQLHIIGSSGWDTSTKVYITNGASDYGRTNLILTGRMQSGNDVWSFGSGARNSVVFSSNYATSGQNIGAIGSEQFSIQHEQASNSLGFLSQTNGQSPLLVMTQSGNIGIGTTVPAAKLHVRQGAIMASDPTYNGINVRLDGSSIPIIRFTRWTGVGSDQHNAFIGQFYNSALGSYSLGIGTGISTTGDQDVATNVITIPTNGNVGIGVSTPDAKLAVNGQIHATEVKVTTSVPGPDYVFEKDYHLPSLESIKSYIDQHKHLPEVPSAKEMEANGINLGEMNMLLLKKVEELTLYVIQQQKEINLLMEEINNKQ